MPVSYGVVGMWKSGNKGGESFLSFIMWVLEIKQINGLGIRHIYSLNNLTRPEHFQVRWTAGGQSGQHNHFHIGLSQIRAKTFQRNIFRNTKTCLVLEQGYLYLMIKFLQIKALQNWPVYMHIFC